MNLPVRLQASEMSETMSDSTGTRISAEYPQQDTRINPAKITQEKLIKIQVSSVCPPERRWDFIEITYFLDIRRRSLKRKNGRRDEESMLKL